MFRHMHGRTGFKILIGSRITHIFFLNNLDGFALVSRKYDSIRDFENKVAGIVEGTKMNWNNSIFYDVILHTISVHGAGQNTALVASQAA